MPPLSRCLSAMGSSHHTEFAVRSGVEVSESEDARDLHHVLPPSRVAPHPFGSAGIVVEGVRICSDLGADELDDVAGNSLAGPQWPARVPEKA